VSRLEKVWDAMTLRERAAARLFDAVWSFYSGGP
jgi:hypothetical protein